MGRETEMLFITIVKEDRSIDEFLNADFTFLNERLAKHYGVDGIAGDEFVRVSLDGSKRSGVLTHASILTLTSNPGRTESCETWKVDYGKRPRGLAATPATRRPAARRSSQRYG